MSVVANEDKLESFNANDNLKTEEIEELLELFKLDPDAIKSYTAKLMSSIFNHNIKDINELTDDFRNLIRNNFLEDTDETYEYRDGIIDFITRLTNEVSELSNFKNRFQYNETSSKAYETIFIEDFVIASNILNLDLNSLFDDPIDTLVIKCSSIIFHKLTKHDDVLMKLDRMNYHNSFQKKCDNE
tara:strand:- start:12530 stop:13087 length:558 start_codon:yes stop_codon:yes gene_type:complete